MSLVKFKLVREEKLRAAAHLRKLKHIGEQGRRKLAAERMEVFRNEHDMLLPIPLNR